MLGALREGLRWEIEEDRKRSDIERPWGPSRMPHDCESGAGRDSGFPWGLLPDQEGLQAGLTRPSSDPRRQPHR